MEADDMCGICYDDISSNQISTDECGHKFDKECMNEYLEHARQQFERTYHETEDEDRPQLETRPPCPVCRTPLNEEQFTSTEK